jgi:hypothetical protein
MGSDHSPSIFVDPLKPVFISVILNLIFLTSTPAIGGKDNCLLHIANLFNSGSFILLVNVSQVIIHRSGFIVIGWRNKTIPHPVF